MDTLFKTFSAEVKALPDSRTIKFLISTDAIDRDGDTLDPSGWDLKAYLANPVVLWGHDYSGLPVAKAISLETTPHGLAATAAFPEKGVHTFADTVYELLKGGFLSAASVGFRPIEYTEIPERSGGGFRGCGRNYVKQELLEFSVVPIPANPEALVQLSLSAPEHKGLLKPLVDWSEKFLGEYYGERGVWLPASQVEKTFEAITKSELFKPKPIVKGDASGATSTGDGKESDQSASVAMTLEVDEPLVLELVEDVFDVELDLVEAHVQEFSAKALSMFTEQEVTRAINYARGRVS